MFCGSIWAAWAWQVSPPWLWHHVALGWAKQKARQAPGEADPKSAGRHCFLWSFLPSLVWPLELLLPMLMLDSPRPVQFTPRSFEVTSFIYIDVTGSTWCPCNTFFWEQMSAVQAFCLVALLWAQWWSPTFLLRSCQRILWSVSCQKHSISGQRSQKTGED